MQFYFCFIMILLYDFKYGSCIKCHVCNSKGDSACLDPFSHFNESTSLRNCVGRAGELPALMEVVMQKLDVNLQIAKDNNEISLKANDIKPTLICQKIVAVVDGELMTSRGCSPTHVDEMPSCEALAMSVPRLQLKHCTTCPTDACNTATHISTSTILRIFIPYITILTSKYFLFV